MDFWLIDCRKKKKKLIIENFRFTGSVCLLSFSFNKKHKDKRLTYCCIELDVAQKTAVTHLYRIQTSHIKYSVIAADCKA